MQNRKDIARIVSVLDSVYGEGSRLFRQLLDSTAGIFNWSKTLPEVRDYYFHNFNTWKQSLQYSIVIGENTGLIINIEI